MSVLPSTKGAPRPEEPAGDQPIVPRSFYEWAAADPGRIAIWDDDGSSTTFGDLLARVNRLAHGLRGLGLEVGDSIAGVLGNSADFVALALATGQVGMYLVPLNWHLTAPELAYIVADSQARAVVAEDADQAAKLGTVELPALRFVRGAATSGWAALIDLESGQPSWSPVDRTSGDLMGYTSGTTGRPKGVRRFLSGKEPEEALPPLLQFAQLLGVERGAGTHLICSPLYHSAPANFALSSLHLGHTLICHRSFDAERVLSDIAQHSVTDSHMVPTHFLRLLRLPQEIREQYDVSSMRSLAHAGAPCPVPTKHAIIDWLGPIVWEYLGSTEGGVAMISAEEWLQHPGSVGRPMPWVEVRLLDESGEEVPAGEAGTIYFSTGLAPFAYHNDPIKTEASRSGHYSTVGDIGRFDEDGYLYLLDRRDDLIVSGGVNIYPAEVENHLIGHPAVEDVVVFGVPDDEWGSSVVAVVQLINGVPATDETVEVLLQHCLDGLAKFKRPRSISFGPLPRTPSGKVSRRRVREHYLTAGRPTPATQRSHP